MTLTPVIQTEGLSKYYGKNIGVQNLQLEVHEGEVFGFLGPNGAGKTTLIRVLLNLLHPSKGSVRLWGMDSQKDYMQIHRYIGNLPGDFAYWEKMSGQTVLELWARIRKTKDFKQAQVLAERFQADLVRPLGQLSRGNRQKIGLILALFHQPRLLIMDEPTVGLDPLMQAEFMQVLKEYNEKGTTVFLSSHDLAEVEQACHRIGIVKAGRLIAVEEVEKMRTRSDHRVMLRLDGPQDTRPIEQLPGVHRYQESEQHIRFHLVGNPSALIHILNDYKLVDMEITKPTLEELFLHYYAEQDG